MAYREIAKNARESIRVSPTRYLDYDLINVRVYAPPPGGGDPAPTKKGIAINVDQVPDLIDLLYWALGQPCNEDPNSPEARQLTAVGAAELATAAYEVLRSHGVEVHWDSAERLILDRPGMEKYSKWDLHYVLVLRRDLFEPLGGGVFRARRDHQM